MAAKPFHLIDGRRSPKISCSSDEGTPIPPYNRYDSDRASVGSIGSDHRNLLDLSSSPRSSTSSGSCISPLSFNVNMESFQFLPIEERPTNLLEKSIASLPAGSDLKNTLLHIRKQMKHSLLRLKELEEQARNLPTLQVRISVLKEEKRQLLKQLQAKMCMKKNRPYNAMYYNTIRDCKSDTEDDQVEFASVRQKLRMKLSFSSNSLNDMPDNTDYNVCDKCDKNSRYSLNDCSNDFDFRHNQAGTQTKVQGLGTSVMEGHCIKAEHLKQFQLPGKDPTGRKVSTRSIGVGMMRSFSKDCGVGSEVAVLEREDKASQNVQSKITVGCDPLVLERFDKGIMVKQSVKSSSVQTDHRSKVSSFKINMNVQSTGTQTTLITPYVSIGVGVCTIDEDCCTRCLGEDTFITTKSVDEIMANKIDIPCCTSTGVGESSVKDNYLCDKCWNVEVKDKGSGDLSLTDSCICAHRANVKTKNTGTGDFNIHEPCKCDRCIDLSKRNVACGDDLAIESKALHSARMQKTTKSIGVGSYKLTNSFCDSCVTKKVRSIGTGHDIMYDLLCDKCTSIKTISVGTSTALLDTASVSDSCITDTVCDSTSIKMKTIGVGDCCLSDSFCDRCFNLQTKSVGVGDDYVNVLNYFKSSEKLIEGSVTSHVNSSVNNTELQTFAEKDTLSTIDEGTNDSSATLTSDTPESDESSIDHDNPSSDSNGQMSESASGHRARARINEEAISACKLLNGHLYKGKDVGREQLISCMSSVEVNWFECVTSPKCRADDVKSVIKTFRQYIPILLETIVNLKDKDGNNALHYAVTYKNWKVVKVVLSTHGINADLFNQAGYTAVMLAALTGIQKLAFKDIARRLFEIGDVNKKVEETGQTSLMLAINRGRLDMVELLLEAGADINERDNECSTALMCACEHGHTDIARRLLAQPDCNSIVEDNDGSTALSIAMERNFHDIALLIYGHSNFSYHGQRNVNKLNST